MMVFLSHPQFNVKLLDRLPLRLPPPPPAPLPHRAPAGLQGTNQQYGCSEGCSPIKCQDSGFQFISCDDLACIDANGNMVCDSDEGIPC
jgi:hypothetical protein